MPSDINNLLLNYGWYQLNVRETETWAISYTSRIFCVISQATNSSGIDAYKINRFPYDLTLAGFTHNKPTSGTSSIVYYLALGI